MDPLNQPTNQYAPEQSPKIEAHHAYRILAIVFGVVVILGVGFYFWYQYEKNKEENTLDILSEIEKKSTPVDLDAKKRSQELQDLKAGSKPVTITETDQAKALEVLRQRQ